MNKKMIRITPSKHQSKGWRLQNICKEYGQKNNSNEKYQRSLVEQITNTNCTIIKGFRINHTTLQLKQLINPMTQNGTKIPDGFEWSEDFDGIQTINNTKFYYNFKFVCGNGGAQTRTLRDETYNFIKTQLKYLKKFPSTNIIFINILDGDGSFNSKPHFDYLKNQKKYIDITQKCFIGDMDSFQTWFATNN
tara:strand:- start:459 stop:1034 length:576 start_codon:yes stop_codon:yes gene_type:complete